MENTFYRFLGGFSKNVTVVGIPSFAGSRVGCVLSGTGFASRRRALFVLQGGRYDCRVYTRRVGIDVTAIGHVTGAVGRGVEGIV